MSRVPAVMRDRQRPVRIALLGAAAVAGTWAAWVAWSGGSGLNLLGVTVTSRDARKPLLIAAAALTGYILTNGYVPSFRMVVRRLWSTFLRLVPPPPALAVALATTVALGTWVYGSKTAGGADSYGYVSQADLWRTGPLIQPQPWALDTPWPDGHWTFVPLGYTLNAERTALVPVYAPGLPMLMAIAKTVAGQRGMFAVVPIASGILLLATYGLGARLGSRGAGLVAACLVATSPPFIKMALAAMSDVPESAAWALTFYSMLRATPGSALVAGLSAGVAALIRFNLAPLVAIPAAWYVVRAALARSEERAGRFRLAAAFFTGLTPCAVAVGAIAQYFYGSPFRAGYGRAESVFAVEYFWPNLVNYSTWLVEAQTAVPILGLAALLVPMRWLWPAAISRSAVPVFAVFVAALIIEYCFYLVFDVWWYLRFLLPAWPLVMVGVGMVTMAIGRLRWPLLTAAVAAGLVALGVRGTRFEPGVYDAAPSERRYAVAAQMVRSLTEPRSVVLAMQHSGTVRYYAGRLTIMYPALDEAWLDRTVAWLAERNVRAYALLDEWEVPRFKEHFGATALGPLEQAPVGVTERGRVFLYSLNAADLRQTAFVSDRDPYGTMDPAPAPLPPFVINESR
jgi:4-amino-4-deoxy-L-arabinose transferase-like glycosyltransferase